MFRRRSTRNTGFKITIEKVLREYGTPAKVVITPLHEISEISETTEGKMWCLLLHKVTRKSKKNKINPF